MALIENLERDDWQDFLRGSFEYTLDVMKKDRFRRVSSSVDDLRSWLAQGGIHRVKEHLNNQMDMRLFPETKKAAVNEFLEQLVRENRSSLLELRIQGILPSPQQEGLSACGLSEEQLEDLLSRILAGERPFEEWMHAHGRSDEEIAQVYRVIDQWLMQRSLIPPLDPSRN